VEQAAAYGAAEPAKSSGGALRVTLIVVAIVAGVGILGAVGLGVGAWRISKSVTASNKSNDALFSIPGLGSISTGSDAPAQLGVPVYPGAVQQKGALSVGLSAAAVAEAHFTTSDSVSQVAAFYESNMPGAILAQTGGATVLNAGPSATARVTVTITAGSGSNAGQTMITIVNAAKN
jgi:hypothetical protein